MGLGLSITVSEYQWPEETIQIICSQCGSVLGLTRYLRTAEAGPPAPLAARETEQYCPVCGVAACEEPQKQNKNKNNQKLDFFKLFGR